MHKSALEIFVKQYVKQHKGKPIQKVFLQKAVTIISEKVDPTCCTNPNGTINYHTTADNNFTRGVKGIINAVPLSGNKFSYVRTINYLNNIINGVCC